MGILEAATQRMKMEEARYEEQIAALKAENERLTKEAESYRDIAARKSNQVAEMIRAEALSRTGAVKVKALVNSLLDLRDLIMRGKRCVTDTGPAVKPVIELAAVHILDDAANALEALSALEPAAPEAFAYRDENGQPQVQRMNETCKCDPIFHEYHDDGVKHCRSCDAEWHPPLQAAPDQIRENPAFDKNTQSDQPVTAAPEGQQPVAWRYRWRAGGGWKLTFHFDNGLDPEKYEQQPLFTRPAEQAVTKDMVNAAYNEGKNRGMTGMPNDFRAVLQAALAQKEEGR